MRPKRYPEVILLRLPPGTLARLRAGAARHHLPTAALVRQFVLAALEPPVPEASV